MTVSQSVISRSHPRSPLHRLSIRLRRSRTTTSTEYSLPGATQLSQVRSVSPSERMVVIHVFRVCCVSSVAVQCPVCPVFVVPALPRSLLRVSHVPRRSPGVFFVFTVPYRFGTNTHTSDDHSTCMHAFHICSLSQTFPRTALQIEACASSPMLRLFPRKHTVNVPVTLLCL